MDRYGYTKAFQWRIMRELWVKLVSYGFFWHATFRRDSLMTMAIICSPSLLNLKTETISEIVIVVPQIHCKLR